MKLLFLLTSLLMITATSLAQDNSNAGNEFELGMFNSVGGRESFTVIQDFDFVSFQLSSLPLFANQFKIFSSTGISAQVLIKRSENTKLYSYTGIQHIQSELKNNPAYINVGAGLGFRTRINTLLEFVCQGGYHSLNTFRENKRIVFNSEVGVYYHF